MRFNPCWFGCWVGLLIADGWDSRAEGRLHGGVG